MPACDPAEEVDAGTDTGGGGNDTGVDAPVTIDAPIPSDDVPAAMDSGTDAGEPVDGGGVCTADSECATELACVEGACECPAALALTSTESLQISEVAPGMYIELFNAGSTPIDLGASGFEFCSPFNYAPVGTGTVAPGAYISVPWPVGFSDTAARGQMILYRNNSYATPASVMDFVCWGTGTGGRLSTAEAASRWSGGCAPALTGGAIHRLTATDGASAASYDTTSPRSGATCAP